MPPGTFGKMAISMRAYHFHDYIGCRSRNVMTPEETIDFPIRKVWSRISRIYNSEASKYGGTMAIGQVLLNIRSSDGATSSAMKMTPSREPGIVIRSPTALAWATSALSIAVRIAAERARRLP